MSNNGSMPFIPEGGTMYSDSLISEWQSCWRRTFHFTFLSSRIIRVPLNYLLHVLSYKTWHDTKQVLCQVRFCSLTHVHQDIWPKNIFQKFSENICEVWFLAKSRCHFVLDLVNNNDSLFSQELHMIRPLQTQEQKSYITCTCNRRMIM